MTRRAADRREQPVDGRRTGREEALTDIRVERQMAVPLHGRDQAGQDGLEAFATDAIRGLPEDDEGLADRLRIDPPADATAYTRPISCSPLSYSNGRRAVEPF